MSYALYSPHLAPLGLATPDAVVARNAALAAGQAALRAQPCYSAELEACISAKTPTDFPNCAVIQAGYAVSVEEMNKINDGMPYCPLPAGPPIAHYVAAAAFGLAAGLFLGAVL